MKRHTVKRAEDLVPGDVVWVAHASPPWVDVVEVEHRRHGRVIWLRRAATLTWVWLCPPAERYIVRGRVRREEG